MDSLNSHVIRRYRSLFLVNAADESFFFVGRPNIVRSWVNVIYKALCFDVAQGRMNGAPNETRTHSCRSASLAC